MIQDTATDHKLHILCNSLSVGQSHQQEPRKRQREGRKHETDMRYSVAKGRWEKGKTAISGRDKKEKSFS